MVKTRGIQGKLRESGIEYVQELENLKKEINNSGKKIENLSGLIENFSDLNNLHETIKDFHEDHIFSRIESKIDIIAQADSAEIVSLLIDELSNDIENKYESLSSKIVSLEELQRQIMSKSGQIALSDKESLKEDLNEKEDINFVSLNYKQILENLNDLQKIMAGFKADESKSRSFEEFANEIRTSLSAIDKYEFQGLEQKLDILTETLKNSSLVSLEKLSDLDQNVNGIKSHIVSEISGNLSVLEENLSGINQGISKISEAFEQKNTDEQINEKINCLLDIVRELRENLDFRGKIKDENSENASDFGKSSPQAEYITKNIVKITNLFEQIRIRLSDESFENEVRQGFLSIEENFERIKEEVDSINTKVEENRLPDAFREEFYDLHNLETLNQSFQAAQDKLNILVDSVENHSLESIKNELDLENKFNEVHFCIDTRVVNNLSAIKDCLGEIKDKQNDSEEIKNAVLFLKQGLEEIVRDLKYSTKNNISDSLLQPLINEVSSVKELISNNPTNTKINEINAKITDFDLKISGLQQTSQLNESVEFIRKSLFQLEEKFNYTNEKISNFAKFIAKNSNGETSPVNEQLVKITEELNLKIEHNSENLNEFLNKFSRDLEGLQNPQDLIQLKENLSFLSKSFRGVSENISVLCEEVHSLKDIQKKVETIHSRMSFASSNEEISEINDKIDTLTEEIRTYRENLSLIQQNSPDREVLESGLDEIKGISSQVSDDVSELKTVMSDLFEAIASMDNPENKELDRQKLQSAIDRMESVINSTKPEFEELKTSSGNLSEKLDKFFELGKSLEARISDSSLHNENRLSAANETLDEIRNEFSCMGEELSEFDKDLSDLNSKINRLIINSNDNTGSLKEDLNNSLGNLKEDIRQSLEKNALSLNQTNKAQVNNLSQSLAQIYKKIEGLNALSVKGFNSSDILREAILQMAEWIDSAGKLLEENNENTRKNLDNTNNVLKSVSDSRKNVLDQINKACRKFDDFEVRLESIEAKIERIKDQNSEDDIKQMILELKQAIPPSTGKKNENNLVLKKIDKLETQMILFETKIQRVLEFVEQEKT